MSHWLSALLVASLAGGIEMRVAAPQPPQGGAASAMVQFYGVDRTGMSFPENPLATGFALDSSASFDPESPESGAAAQPEQAGYAGQTRHGNPAQLSIRLEYPSQRRRDSFRRELDEFRCENHGFFYTAGGRCVVPARQRTTRFPRNRPVARTRHVTQERGPLPDTGPAR
jgi:hypothetical protein